MSNKEVEKVMEKKERCTSKQQFEKDLIRQEAWIIFKR